MTMFAPPPSGGSGSDPASSGKGVSGTNKNPEGLICGDSTICYRTVKVEGVTKDSDTTATIQLDYKSSSKVYGYQFVIEFDSSLTITSPSINVSERAGSQPGFQISVPQALGGNRFLVFGFFSSAGTFLAPAETDTNFLTIEITTSNNAFAGLSSSDVTNKTSIVYANDNINSPSSPNPVFAILTTSNIKNDSWSGFGDDTSFNTFTDEIADIYQSGLIFDATNWNKSKDTRLKGYYDITDLCSHKLFRIDGSKILFDYICEEQMISDSDCTVCESPKDIATTSDCDSEICILNSTTSKNGKEAVITFGYKSTCRISGYEITLGGLKSRTAFQGVGGALKILQLDDQEAYKKQWLENLGRDPALSNSDRLTYNAPDEKINTRIFGFSFGRLLHQNEDGTVDLGDLNSPTTAWSLPSTGGKFKKLTRVVVNLESFSSIPVLSSFKMVTSETLKAPVNDYSNNWTAIDLNGFLGSVSHSTVGVKDLMACLYYYREGFGGAESSPYDSLNTFTQKFISETGRSELAISDVLAVGNHITIKGLDTASDNTALIVPSDCCSITLPGDFTLSGTFIACNQPTNPGKISLAIGQSTSATGYNVYRKARIISESYKTPDSALINKFLKEGIVRTEDLYATKLEFLTTLSTHQTYIDLPSVPVRDCSLTHEATYYVIAFNSAGEVAKEVTVSYNCCDGTITTPDVSLTRVMNSDVEIFLPVTFNDAPAFFGNSSPETGVPVSVIVTSVPSLGGRIDSSFANEGKLIYRPPENLLGKVEFTYTARAMSRPGAGPSFNIEQPGGIIELNFIPPDPNFTITPFGCGEENSGKVLITLQNEVGDIAETTWVIQRKLSTSSSFTDVTKIESRNHVGEREITLVDEPGISECCNADVIYNYRITAQTTNSSNTVVTSEPTIVSVTVECCALENVTNLSTSATSCSDSNHPEVTVTWNATNTATSGKTVERYIVYRKPHPTGGPYVKVGTTDEATTTFKDSSLPSQAIFATSSSYKYAVVTQAKDGSVSGDPNHANWGLWNTDSTDAINEGDSCSQGGSESLIAVSNCATAPCPQSETVEICAGETDFSVQLNYGCIIKGQESGILFAETSGGTAPAGLVTIDVNTGVATINTTGVAVGTHTQNFTVTDTAGQVGSGVLTINVVDCDCGCHNSDATYVICDVDKENSEWTAPGSGTTVEQVPFSVPGRPNPRGPTSPESHPPVITQEDGFVPSNLPEAPSPPGGGGGSGGGGGGCSVMKLVGIDTSGLSNGNGEASSVTFTVSGVGSQDCAQKFYNLEEPHSIISGNWGNYMADSKQFTTTWDSDYEQVTISWINSKATGTSASHRYISLHWRHNLDTSRIMSWAFRMSNSPTNSTIVDTNWGAGKLIAEDNAIISPPYVETSSGINQFLNSFAWKYRTQGSTNVAMQGPLWKLQLSDFVTQDNHAFVNYLKEFDYYRGAVTMTIGGTDYYLIDYRQLGTGNISDASHRMHSQVTSGRTEYSVGNSTGGASQYVVPFGKGSSATATELAIGYYGDDNSGTKSTTIADAPDNNTNVTFYFPANYNSTSFAGSNHTHTGAMSDLKIVISMNDGTAGNMTLQAFRADDGVNWTEVTKLYPVGHDYE